MNEDEEMTYLAKKFLSANDLSYVGVMVFEYNNRPYPELVIHDGTNTVSLSSHNGVLDFIDRIDKIQSMLSDLKSAINLCGLKNAAD
jgi:hypothetical protein